MGSLRRGVRNAARNRARSALVAAMVAVSVAVTVAMVQVSGTTQRQGQALRASVATLIQLNPRGAPGGGGGEATLPEELESEIRAIPNVAEVEKVLRRQMADNSKPFAMGVVNGVEPGRTLRLAAMGGFVGDPSLLEGRSLEPADRGRPVAVVGTVFARQYGVEVGSAFTLDPAILRRQRAQGPQLQPIRLGAVGLFSVDVVYGDNQIFLPLDVAQDFLGKDGQVSQLLIRVDGAENVAQVEEVLRQRLGERADILTEQAAAREATSSLQAMSSGSMLAAGLATLVGVAVVFLAMVLVTRERTQEIGVLKAIGASNREVILQYVAESLTLAIGGGLAGLLLATVGGSRLTGVLLGPTAQTVAGGELGLTLAAAVYALGLTALFGALGSLYPAWRAAALRPAEALRPA